MSSDETNILKATVAKHSFDIKLKRTSDVFAIISSSAVFITLTFGYWEYERNNWNTRVERTDRLIEEWNDKGYSSALDDIRDAIVPLFELEKDRIVNSKSEKERDLRLSNIGLKIINLDADRKQNIGSVVNRLINGNAKIEKQVSRIYAFYDRVNICYKTAACDKETTLEYFGQELGPFWIYFSGYAKKRQEQGSSGFGDGTKHLFEELRKMKPDLFVKLGSETN